MLESEQRVALSEKQWMEIYDICEGMKPNLINNQFQIENRAVSFIRSIYLYAFTYDPHNFPRRYNGERLSRMICLCDPETKQPLTVTLDTSQSAVRDGKVKAKIIQVYSQRKIIHLPLEKRAHVYVPEGVKGYQNIRNGMINNSTRYELWFNLGGALVRDVSEGV